MDSCVLDNPVWHSLTTCHSRFAIGKKLAKKYPDLIAPFVGVGDTTREAFAELEQLVSEDELVYLMGFEEPFPTQLHIEHHAPITQMTAQRRTVAADIAENVLILTVSDAPDMLALIELTFPGYFRSRTLELGTYFGIRDGDRLVAMAGERMSMTGFCEISAVCTHPDHRGRGYAQYLMALLINKLFDEGVTPFLHVDIYNEKAKSIYGKLGFAVRRDIPLKAVSR